ncbi:tyrosine-type recombinase/integrase [Kribbella sp. NPDC054772]
MAVSDIDFLRGVIHVQRQVKIVKARLVFGLPKGGKVRDVPLPESVGNELAAYLQALPAKSVTLPWDSPTGRLVAADLILTSREGKAMNRNYFNPFIWKPSLKAASIETTRDNGMHVLRHTYASVLLHAGESIKTVSEYLGHSDAGFTLRVYTHLMPDSETRARQAIDQAFSATAVDPALTPGVLRAVE